jgi:hypothetical protein
MMDATASTQNSKLTLYAVSKTIHRGPLKTACCPEMRCFQQRFGVTHPFPSEIARSRKSVFHAQLADGLDGLDSSSS